MADDGQAAKLKEEIDFLTNLINDAKSKRSAYYGKPRSFNQQNFSHRKWTNPSQGSSRNITKPPTTESQKSQQNPPMKVESAMTVSRTVVPPSGSSFKLPGPAKTTTSIPPTHPTTQTTQNRQVAIPKTKYPNFKPPGSPKSTVHVQQRKKVVGTPVVNPKVQRHVFSSGSSSSGLKNVQAVRPFSAGSQSPTIIQAGKKIIEEIEKLKKAQDALEKAEKMRGKMGSSSKLKTSKPNLTTERKSGANYEQKLVQNVDQKPGPKVDQKPGTKVGSTAPSLNVVRNTRYTLVKKSQAAEAHSFPAPKIPAQNPNIKAKTHNRTVISNVTAQSRNPNVWTRQAVQSRKIPTKNGPPLVKISTSNTLTHSSSNVTMPKTPVMAQARTSTPNLSNQVRKSPLLSGNREVKLQRNQISGNRYSLVRSSETSKRTVKSPQGIQRRRVVVTRNKLYNSPVPNNKYKLVKKHSTTSATGQAASPKPKTVAQPSKVKSELKESKVEPKKKQSSSVVNELLRELSVIDIAFKTAKLQSSQRLVRKAVMMKQKSLQRRNTESRSPNTASGTGKWGTSGRRRSRSRSTSAHVKSDPRHATSGHVPPRHATSTHIPPRHVRPGVSPRHVTSRYVRPGVSPRHPTSGHVRSRKHQSRFSLRKNTADESLSMNQLLGRKIKNLSCNKYKFVSAGGERGAKTPDKTKVTSTKLRSSRARSTYIDGVLFRSTHSQLRRASNSHAPSKKLNNFGRRQSRALLLGGNNFRLTRNGCTLKRVGRLSLSQQQDTPQRHRIQSRSQSFSRQASFSRTTATHRTASQAISRSIATAVVAARLRKLVKPQRQYCIFYNRFGKCNRGEQCPYIHDPDKIAVCTRYLRGTCKVTDCPFSHQVSREKMPVCTHYLRGVCARDHCPYLHVNVSRDAEVCQDFINGYCGLGDKCKKKHTLICPVHDGQGGCAKGQSCKLKHPQTAGKRSRLTSTSQSKPGAKRARIERENEEEDDERDLPMGKRRLPSFILLEREGEEGEEEGCKPTTRRAFSVDGPLQIHPNLSFDGN